MAKIEKFKNFAQNFQRKWNDDTPTEIILPDLNTEEEDRQEKEMDDELDSDSNDEITESLTTEIEDHIKTIFSQIEDEGYYNVDIITVEIKKENKICSEIKLEPIEGKLWYRPKFNPTIDYIETSYERENEILRVKQQTINKIKAIIEDLKSEGAVVKMMVNRLGLIKISITEEL